ncbi:hypothetical protein [Helicobacter suis]|uniref:hypothetical protein n=1 Tax=Helicobacter suis TaxID=104628 RepID=UPI0013D00962|nr:hypothetical protein [Helicobacter suis]
MRKPLYVCLGSVALASCLVSPLMAFKSAEYYATHNEERKRVLKKCDDLAVSALQQGKDLSKEQKSMCGNAERGRQLAHQRVRKQKRNNMTMTLAQCYIKMANGLEKGQDVLKTDEKCKLLVRRSVFVSYSFSLYPLPQLYDINVRGDIYADEKTHKYDNPHTRHAVLIKCYKTFSSQLRKYGSYQPLKTDFRHECRDALAKELDYPVHTLYDPLRDIEF